MSLWRAIEVLGVGAAVLLGGAVAGVGVSWLLNRAARRWAVDDTPMGTTYQTYPPLKAQEVDAVRAAAEKRRDWAEDRKAEGRAIETGDPPDERIIAMAGRR